MRASSFLERSLLLFIVNSLLIACQPIQISSDTGTLQIVFDNVVGDQDLQLRKGNYTNVIGEPFNVTLLNYFVSNIRLHRSDGSSYIVPQDSSYFLISESDTSSQTITLRGVPTGGYSAISFLVGVDSLRSTMDIARRKGVLEPGGVQNNGMYWDWNSGYIFFKLEGSSPLVAADPVGENRFLFHVGLFGGYSAQTINNLRAITLPFAGNAVRLNANESAQITIQADVLKVFDGPTRVSLVANPAVMVSTYSAIIATNYAHMFRCR